jgi:bifunctional oligoribonuclease and PAP phosphatase NrnA
MSTKGRGQRVGELLRQEIAQMLTKGLKDPRIGFVSVMDVEMSKDLHYATVNVSLFGSESERKSSLIALQNSAGWIRREIGRNVRLRFTPEIRFRADETLDNVYALEKVFDEIKDDREEGPMIRIGLAEVLEELKSASSFLITSHVSPDGDAVGSLLALRWLLEAMGKRDITCVLADPIPEVYTTLPGADQIKSPADALPDYELAVVVDVARLERVGDVAKHIPADKKTLIIDHHLEENPDGTCGFIDASYAAAGEIIVELFGEAGQVLSPDAARCAYVAQITDTGGYRYSNTNSRSHQVAATLHESDIDHADICGEVFERNSRAKILMLRLMLERMDSRCDDRIVSSYLTSEDLDAVGGKKEDFNGLVNFLRNIDGVVVGILFNGVDENTTKASIRSDKAFNAAEFLQEFGGGGHAAAAGVTMSEPIDTAMNRVLARMEELLGNPTG